MDQDKGRDQDKVFVKFVALKQIPILNKYYGDKCILRGDEVRNE